MNQIKKIIFSGLLCLWVGCHPPIKAPAPYSSWTVAGGGDLGASHYSSLDQININNVRHLKVAWIYHCGDADTGSLSQIECNPIMIGKTLYFTSPKLKLIALNARTGQLKWSFDPAREKDKINFGLNFNRGVTYWSCGKDQRIFYTAGSYLFAIDAQTGLPIKNFGTQGKVDLHDGLDRDVKNLFVVATSPGIIYKNLLILGTRVAESMDAAPGHIRAYDVRTGKRVWIFHTIPHPGEPGYSTWQNKSAWKYTGGANCWAGMSLDKKRGMVFIPTGSASFDFYGGLRKGQDLFANCLLALNAATGQLIWYYQTIHHDLWDRDLPCPPTLVRVKFQGKWRDAVAQVTKTGFLFLLDRESGMPIFPVHEEPVPHQSGLIGESPWPTQPVPDFPPSYVRQRFQKSAINPFVPARSQKMVLKKWESLQGRQLFDPPSLQGTLMLPGFDGGAEWGGPAYDPTSGMLYVNANDVPWVLTMVRVQQVHPLAHRLLISGQAVYQQHCMACHGQRLQGNPGFPSLVHIASKLTTTQMEGIIAKGRGMMPGFSQIPADQKQELLAFLKGLPSEISVPDSLSLSSDHPEEVTIPTLPYGMTGYHKWVTPEGYPAIRPPWGTLTAINLNRGTISWQVPLGDYPELDTTGKNPTGTENYGGAIITAGKLLFIAATRDAKFRAIDPSDGRTVWETSLPACGFATPCTYMDGGKQYIVVTAGGGKLGTPSSDTYIAFDLGK
ncbi:MAG: outer membrane protein assembly factor BamB family protein [Chitinophagaceae bacterium]